MVDINKLVNKLKNEYGSVKTGEDITDFTEFVSTGNLTFDLILGGGIPFGVGTELLGFSSSGKSLFIQNIFANAQKKYNAICILADRENAFTKQRALEIGINLEKTIVVKPQDIPTATSMFNFIISTIDAIREEDKNTNIEKIEDKKGKKKNNANNVDYEKSYIVVAIDSIASFDKEAPELETADVGRRQKSLHEGFRRLLTRLDEKVMLITANQKHYKIGVLFGDNTQSSSGESVKYYHTIRVALEDKKKIIDPTLGNEIVGNWIGIETIKTRLGPCFRQATIQHLYKTGIDYYSGYCRMLVDKNYLQPKNKSEFDKFKQTTVLYKDTSFSEHNIEEKLKEFPELLFDKYPEYNMEK